MFNSDLRQLKAVREGAESSRDLPSKPISDLMVWNSCGGDHVDLNSVEWLTEPNMVAGWLADQRRTLDAKSLGPERGGNGLILSPSMRNDGESLAIGDSPVRCGSTSPEESASSMWLLDLWHPASCVSLHKMIYASRGCTLQHHLIEPTFQGIFGGRLISIEQGAVLSFSLSI